jgi:hypothetical protein
MAETASARLTALYVPLYLFDFRNVVVAVWRPPERNFERIYKDPCTRRKTAFFATIHRGTEKREDKRRKTKKEKKRKRKTRRTLVRGSELDFSLDFSPSYDELCINGIVRVKQANGALKHRTIDNPR